MRVGPRVVASVFIGGAGTIEDQGIGTTVRGGYQTVGGERYRAPPLGGAPR